MYVCIYVVYVCMHGIKYVCMREWTFIVRPLQQSHELVDHGVVGLLCSPVVVQDNAFLFGEWKELLVCSLLLVRKHAHPIPTIEKGNHKFACVEDRSGTTYTLIRKYERISNSSSSFISSCGGSSSSSILVIVAVVVAIYFNPGEITGWVEWE